MIIKKYNFDHIFINGCSHTAGSEIEGSGLGDTEYNRTQCFGAKLARRLGVEYTNIAMPGASNDYIFRTSNFWLHDNIHKAKNSLFLIHWTGSARTEFFHTGMPKIKNEIFWQFIPFVPDENVGHVHPGYQSFVPPHEEWMAQHIAKSGFYSDVHWDINRYMNVINLQNMLKVHQIKYIFRNALEQCNENDRFIYYRSRVDASNFKGLTNNNLSFYEHCLNQGFDITGQLLHHHKEEAHEYWADKLFKENFE